MIQPEHYLHEFDAWVSLARADPMAFEHLRQTIIEDYIAQAPADRQQRLRCLQWRIEQERARSKTPLGACIRISRMMWDKVTAPGGLVDHLQQLQALGAHRGGQAVRAAKIILFPDLPQ